MVCQGSFEGALLVGYDDEDAEELLELVQGIARQAALALVNVRTIEQRQEDAEVSRVLLEISRGLSACLDEEALWSLLVRGASEVLGLPWAIATRFDEHAGRFGIAGSHGIPESELGALAAARFRLEDFPQMQEALSRCEVVVADESPAGPLPVSPDLRVGSWIAIPLIRGGWVAGFLAAGTAADSVAAFSRRQLRLAEGLGHHASIALQNARLVADLEAADQLKTEFVSTMSHELRTPLHVILGSCEMARDAALPEADKAACLGRIDAAGRTLLELIESTLEIGKLEAGRDDVRVEAVALRTWWTRLGHDLVSLPRRHGVTLEWAAGAPDIVLHTDPRKLAIVVRNLVGNALKFTEAGFVRADVEVDPDRVLLRISDSGVGIRAEDQERIFEMFRQADGSDSRRFGGTGLGLYIVRRFVEQLGGTVSVESALGRGSVFVVSLPRSGASEGIRPAA
jgi:signal transduction histidine kinase